MSVSAAAPSRTYSALGHRFRCEVPDPELARWLDGVLAPLVGDGPPELVYRLVADPDGGRLLAGRDELARGRRHGPLLGALLWHVNRAAVRRAVTDHVVVHAAAAARSGIGVLLPAPMEHGKTTTVAGLLLAGYRYVTDEAVAIDPRTLHAVPFPKALSVDEGSWRVLPSLAPREPSPTPGQWQVPVPQRQHAGEVPIRLVISPRYDPGRPTAVVPVTRGQMVELLAASTFHLREHARRDLDVLAALVAGADCYRLSVRTLGEAVDAVDRLVDQLL